MGGMAHGKALILLKGERVGQVHFNVLFPRGKGEINFQQAYVLKIYYGKLHLGIKTIMFHMINFEVYFVWTTSPNLRVKFVLI